MAKDNRDDRSQVYSPAPTDSTIRVNPGANAGSPVYQRDLDRRALYLPSAIIAGQPKLSRGIMYQDRDDPAVSRNPGGRPLGFQFLYNPTDVQTSYAMDTSRYPSDAQPEGAGSEGAGGVALLGIPGSTSVSWSLILDRTYDTWNRKAALGNRGIIEDVQQFEKMVRYSKELPFVQAVAMHVIFGNPVLSFYGFVTSFQILYSYWTAYMVPMRGALSGISFQVLPAKRAGATQAYAQMAAESQFGAFGAATDPTTSPDEGSGR